VSWKIVKLGEVTIINPSVKGRLPDTNDWQVSFVPMTAVDAITGMITNHEVKKLGEVRRGYTYFENNDVIFAKITPCMQNGKHAIAKNLINGLGFGSTEFHVIRPIADEISSEWIHYFLRQPKYLLSAENYMQGAVGQQRLPDDYLCTTQIPLPPLAEQKRIVGIIEKKFKAIEKAKQAAEEQLKAAEALQGAYLREVFGFDELPEGWEWVRLGDICKTISGGTPTTSKREYYENGIIPWLISGEINQGIIKEVRQSITKLGLKNSSAKIIPENSVLVAMYGATAGQIGLVKIETAINQAICAILTNEKIIPEFLYYFLRSRKNV
jgi:type I restriction enzyme S subunit